VRRAVGAGKGGGGGRGGRVKRRIQLKNGTGISRNQKYSKDVD
jgi:hypothetical protein